MKTEMTMNTGETREPRHGPSTLTETWMHEVLEPDQLSTTKQRFGRAQLTRGTVALLWGLRIYVILMILLIGVQIWSALHTGG
jgi:hypothetical protein